MNEHAPTLIADLEARIEDLAEQRLRAGKAVLLGRFVMWAGVALLGSVFVGLFILNRTELGVLGLGLSIGGVVVGGSSRATERQLSADIDRLEAARAEAIDQLNLAFVRAEEPNVGAVH